MKEKVMEPQNSGVCFELPVAKGVLYLCRLSFEKFKKDRPTGDDYRLHYFLILTLLRTVRDGLKIDCKDPRLHPDIAKEIELFFSDVEKNKPEPEIYWKFITNEANKLFHEFDSPEGARQSADSLGKRLYTLDNDDFKGKNQQYVIKDAINWWDKQLEDIIIKAGAPKLTALGII